MLGSFWGSAVVDMYLYPTACKESQPLSRFIFTGIFYQESEGIIDGFDATQGTIVKPYKI
jgi:hypothetical protein